MSRPTPLSGFPELLPSARVVEREVIASLSRTFELHGFANIETRAVEPLDRLAKGGEIDKEIYVLRRLEAASDIRNLLRGHFGSARNLHAPTKSTLWRELYDRRRGNRSQVVRQEQLTQ